MSLTVGWVIPTDEEVISSKLCVIGVQVGFRVGSSGL